MGWSGAKPKAVSSGSIYRARILNPTKQKALQWYEDALLVVDNSGKIISISKKSDVKKFKNFKFIDLWPQIIMPGLIDAHAHIPQYAFAGIGHLPLLEWLKTYTFPHEESFSQVRQQSQSESLNFFRECLRYGTTTVVAYATSGIDSTHECFRAAEKVGIRAFIGLVLMDVNVPKSQRLRSIEAIKAQESLILKWHKKGNLNYVVSPRFALSCSRKMLEEAGQISKHYKTLLQTHISENTDEIKAVLKLHPWAKTYTEVYEKTGCLGPHALLGHGVHLSDRELKILAQNNARIIHCPTSNRFLGSGSMPLRKIQSYGVSVALGSDVAGGYSLSMFNEMREACETSKSFGMKNSLDPIEAFWMATIGAAEAIGMSERVGCLKKNFDADFIVVDDRFVHPLQSFSNKQNQYSLPHEILSRLMYRSHPDMVRQAYVKGVCVNSASGAFR